MNIGDIVTAIYKTGKYIGEITAIKPGQYVVRVLAVIKHPIQGDLHNPKTADVSFFHERKALAYREQANIPEKMVKPFEGEVPEYNESLKEAFGKLKEDLNQNQDDFSQKSLESLASIQREYELMYGLKLDE